MADKTGIDDPISDQSTASTSGISRGSRSQKKKPEAVQAEKQAKSSKDSNVADKLDILITSVSNSRLALLETQVEKKGPESSDDVITQADEFSHENFENEIEDSEEDANQFDSESFNDSFDAGVITDNVGLAIDKGIASRINEGLLLEVQQNTGIPVRTGVSRAYRYGSAVRYVPVHSGVFGSLYGNCRSSVTRHCLTSV